MSRKEKLIRRLLSMPSDYRFDELETLLRLLGYEIDNKGKTSGSRVLFKSTDGRSFIMHKPHPSNVIRKDYLSGIINKLREDGEIL